MRHFVLLPFVGLSILAFAAACATSPEDHWQGYATDNDGTEADDEENSAKLPPPSNGGDASSSAPTDSGAKDAGKPNVDAGSDAGTSSSSSSSSGSSGTTTGDCDMSNPIIAAIYTARASQVDTPELCPCAATKCCYLKIVCIDK